MLSLHYLIEVLKLYIIAFHILNIPQRRKLWFLSLVMVFLLAVFDMQRFLSLDGQLIEHYYDMYICVLIALATMLYILQSIKLKLVFILICTHIFNSFLSTLIAGFVIQVSPITINTIMNNPLHGTLVRSISIPILLLLVYITKNSQLKINASHLKWKQLILAFLGLITFGFYVGLVQQFGNGEFASLMATSSGFIIICIVVAFILQGDRLEKIEILRLTQEELIHRQRRYHLAFIEQTQETKKFRHDTANHYIAMMRLLEKKNYLKLEKYVKDLSGSLAKIKDYTGINTGWDVVDAILFDLQSRYKKNGIKVVWGRQLPKNSKISDTDMAVLFMNLLENAFMAASKCESQRLIEIEIGEDTYPLYISVKNSYNGELLVENGDIKTLKKDKKNHGFGLKIIQDMVDQYDGECRIAHHGNEFKVEITLI